MSRSLPVDVQLGGQGDIASFNSNGDLFGGSYRHRDQTLVKCKIKSPIDRNKKSHQASVYWLVILVSFMVAGEQVGRLWYRSGTIG